MQRHNEEIMTLNSNTQFRKNEVTTHEANYFSLDLTTSYTDNNVPEISEKSFKRHQRSAKDLNMNHYNATLNKDDKIQIMTPNEEHFVKQKSEIFKKRSLTIAEAREAQGSIMKKYIDNSINPCDDFYEFACGNWENYHKMPADKLAYDVFETTRRNLDLMLKDLLSEVEDDLENKFYKNEILTESHSETESNPIHQKYVKSTIYATNPISQVKNLYKSCMNEELINERAEKPLLKLLKQLGGWPIIESNWDEKQFDWLYLIAQLRLYNNEVLIGEEVAPDTKNSEEYIIQFDDASLGLPKEFFLEDNSFKYLEAYHIYITTIVNLLGCSTERVNEDATNIINFETELAKIIRFQEEQENESEFYMKTTVEKLQAIIPQIDWLRYLNIIMALPIKSSQLVVCFSKTYFQRLAHLLTITPSRTIANYVLWRFVRHRVNNLSRGFLEAKQRFNYILFGSEKLPPRWELCVTQINSYMGMALGKIFVERYFDYTSKNDTLQMAGEIRQSFREILLNSNWLDTHTKELALIKIDAMHLRIGYPKYILNLDQLSEKYKGIEIHTDTYFENIMNLLQHFSKVEQNKIFTVVNKTIWHASPTDINAYYSRNKNQIMFPAGILQPPFYQKYFPRCLNYGGIGVVIGHEITHGFDDKGRLFNKDGNLQRWWGKQAIQEFHKRTECLIDQYNSYIEPKINMQIDGFNTRGENIADNGGVKQAFKAYTKWLKSNPDADETLPNLNMTNKQLFFLNFAQVWCGSTRPSVIRNRILTDIHAPARFRVIGALSNCPEFADAYNCPVDSPMNPNEKCTIW
ncbi:hypothetical protein FQA39_LY00237 [Lamprigera yunnana]|nr:hypothetical protein FQA39_LY00237 [Lamprigera yunnana]